MLYVINGKYYVNIAPSIYTEVTVSENGTIAPTKNKVEANNNTVVTTITKDEILKKLKENEKPSEEVHEVRQRHNRRKK